MWPAWLPSRRPRRRPAPPIAPARPPGAAPPPTPPPPPPRGGPRRGHPPVAPVASAPAPPEADVDGGAAVRAPRPAEAEPAAVTVVPGDCLWTIAAGALPRGAGDAAIDRYWRAIYASNRDTVGDDPDLILPGQVLHLPRPP